MTNKRKYRKHIAMELRTCIDEFSPELQPRILAIAEAFEQSALPVPMTKQEFDEILRVEHIYILRMYYMSGTRPNDQGSGNEPS